MVVGGEEVVSIGEKYLLMWVVFVKKSLSMKNVLVMRGCLVRRMMVFTDEEGSV